MSKPVLLDIFCGAGGCTKGYQRAGFYVIGVDIKPQPNYCGDEFKCMDALEFLNTHWDGILRTAAAIHASPPCQRYSALSNATKNAHAHPDLIGPVRELLLASGLPFVIENVPRAPLNNPVQLCGSSLGLRVLRHRLFETNFPLKAPPCEHKGTVSDGSYVGHRDGGRVLPGRVRPPLWSKQQKMEAMGVDWFITAKELREAVPPAYTEHIGRALRAHLG